MRIARIIGAVTLNQPHPLLRGGCLRLATPLSLDDLKASSQGAAEPLVVYDELGAGVGSLVALSEGGEAAQPFYPEMKPIDAYVAAILDSLFIPVKSTASSD